MSARALAHRRHDLRVAREGLALPVPHTVLAQGGDELGVAKLVEVAIEAMGELQQICEHGEHRGKAELDAPRRRATIARAQRGGRGGLKNPGASACGRPPGLPDVLRGVRTARHWL